MQKLDEEYKESKRKNFDEGQRIDKFKKIAETLKKELFDTKQALKLKEIKHTDLVKKLTFIVK